MNDRTTVAQVLAHARQRLDAAEADILLAHALNKPRSWLFAHADDVLADDAVSAFNAYVERRSAGEPVAYLTGTRGFWSLELTVTPATLVPRPETEVLVEQALQRLAEGVLLRIADLGTGSGAVALAIAKERPLAQVVATDASAEALDVARENARRNGITNIEFRQGDWLHPLLGERFDMIVSNPPYIAEGDPHLAQGDLRFEPAMALSSGFDGLDAIRQIAIATPAHLRPSGWLLVEHGYDQGPAARTLLRDAGLFGVKTVRDLEQRDRITLGTKP